MILTCPACGTSYVVKDGAIPPQGRQVRCASCKHSWHQDPEPGAARPLDEAGAAVETAPEPPRPPVEQPAEPAADGSFASRAPDAVPAPVAASADDAGEESAAPRQAFASPEASPSVAMDAGDPAPTLVTHNEPFAATSVASSEEFADWDSFDHADTGARRRKGPLVIALVILFVALLAAAAWFLAPPEMLARAGLREAAGDTPLQLMVTSQDRQKLASGNDLVSLSGRVINPTEQTLAVPPLQADLRNGQGKLVYSWRIGPPAPNLPPRGSASFNAAELGVPADATSLTLRWAS